MIVVSRHERVVLSHLPNREPYETQCEGSHVPPSEVGSAPHDGGMIGRCRACQRWVHTRIMVESR